VGRSFLQTRESFITSIPLDRVLGIQIQLTGFELRLDKKNPPKMEGKEKGSKEEVWTMIKKFGKIKTTLLAVRRSWLSVYLHPNFRPVTLRLRFSPDLPLSYKVAYNLIITPF
jgi:hypothetical protein